MESEVEGDQAIPEIHLVPPRRQVEDPHRKRLGPEKETKRARDDDDDYKAKVNTPQQSQTHKRTKIRGKVARDGYKSKPPVKKASATATPASAETSSEANDSYSRPKRSCRRSLTFYTDDEEEDEYRGRTFTSLPSTSRQSRTQSKKETLDKSPKGKTMTSNDQSVTGRESSTMSVRIPSPNIQNFLSEMQPSLCRKKRRNRDPVASKLNARVLHLQWRRQYATGTTSDEELWERKLSVDSVTKFFKELDIRRDNPCLAHSMETALTLHEEACKKQKALYTKDDGSIIPFPDEKKHQPKVELDEESIRVWNLLMVSIDSEGVDGLDEDKQRWWEEERRRLHERTNSFITRMRLVQGDRRFSPWKGSVIDSVVGVFLTQSVADHSSSSVFMDIAAEFPNPVNAVAAPRRTRNPTGIVIDEIDDDDGVTDSSICCTLNQSKQKGTCIVSTNLNEAPFEVESCDELRNNVDDGSQQQEEKSTIQSQDEEPKTRREQHTKMKGKKKKGQPAKKKAKKDPKRDFDDWDSLRREAEASGQKRERTDRTMDAADWDALRRADVNKIADLIKKRGLHELLSQRIKDFLNRMVKDHGEIDLEWLRNVPPHQTKEYLLSIMGLGLKSVECIRLLSLHQTAFPVDTNIGRIAVRLGWVLLQPLPGDLQMHLLDLYPVLASVQKYLWPRLYKLDQKTLYELHYHMITFGKVFCTKKKPNCGACPMKAECRHYASTRASAQLALPDAEEVTIHARRSAVVCEPIIEEPASPPHCPDIEDFPSRNEDEVDPWENKTIIPTIIIGNKKDGLSTVFEAGTSNSLVVLSNKTTPIARQSLKTKDRLRTQHIVYELPDSHPILRGFEPRDPDDTFPYLLAIWTPENTCFPGNSKTVRGTILIPCRTAMRGRFPLNGTYFQTNEVFADHSSSINPIYVRGESLGSLSRALVYCGSSVSACFGGLSVEEIQYGFWRGYVCVRGFDRRTRKSKPLVRKLHYTSSKK
ncbi:unnamed protein product [Microthlaspi erraticum]|uniref:HhH-GPD domain-containing protein n=1 Tax=Microthlaspi erraticum TaxID=1685480 RepID=A0A6D2LH95_9BRAS|nr:unnamed protein product [Microthlaspi erraticum]